MNQPPGVLVLLDCYHLTRVDPAQVNGSAYYGISWFAYCSVCQHGTRHIVQVYEDNNADSGN